MCFLWCWFPPASVLCGGVISASLYLSSCLSHIKFSRLAEFHALCRVDNFPTDIKLDGQVGPLQCARIFEEKAYTSAVSKVRSSLCATHHLCYISVLVMFEATLCTFTRPSPDWEIAFE